MAEQLAHDVVKSAQSMSAPSPIDDIATSSSQIPADAYLAKSPSPSSFTSDFSGLKSSGHGEDVVQTPVTETTLPIREFSKSPLGDKSSLAEASGGSDTDTSKPDIFGQKDGATGHNRSNSVKKPTSFKSVSVTKNFLAKAVGSPNTRVVEKVPSGQPSPVSNLSASAKPRLVAKSALGGLGTRSGLGSAGSGPDPNTVWNRNKPAPIPTPRQFTDEELKQHYGIHMATRLPADETGKESKWADIDDDEDDWATPEIKWMDGTTSTITISQPDSNQLLPEKERTVEVAEAIIQQPPPPQSTPKSTLSGNRTILKPGGHASAQSKGLGGSILKGGIDGSSPSGQSLPSKSPWAALPPVEKVPPVHFTPPVQQPRFARDPSGFEGFANAALSPKEIAADDFNRVWNNDAPRAKELYIPQSGRFESVNDSRRSSNRGESHRQPAVLQRPGQQGGPAEPSAAFQTHRSGGPEGPHWQRHRTGSMSSTGRRMSLSRSSDQQSDRFDMSASSPRREIAQPHGQRSWTRTSPTLSFAQPSVQDEEEASEGPIVQPEQTESTEPTETTEPTDSQEDVVTVQQRLMREKIEKAKQAKQRQIEEEQREERAKQARLKAKIQALAGPSPPAEVKEARLKLQHSPIAKSAQVNPTQIASPPKPPIPTAEGEVAQYGMMKVHQPHPVRRHQISEGSLIGRQPSDADRRQGGGDANQQKYAPNGRIPAGEKSQKSVADNRRDDSILWRVSELPDTLSGWSVSNSSNVWAPPQSKDRALGNGTFDSTAYVRPASGVAPGVIGTGSRQLPHVTAAPTSNGPGPIARPTSSNVPSNPSSRSQQPVNSSADDKSQTYMDSQTAVLRPQQSGLMQSNASSRYSQFNATADAPQNLGNWSNYREQIVAQDAALEKRSLEAMEEARRNPKARTFHETYYERRTGDKLGESVIVGVSKNVYVEGRQNSNANGPTQQSGPAGFQRATNFAGASSKTGTDTSRGADKASKTQSVPPGMSQASIAARSRFFPKNDAEQSETSDSPPPPDMSSLDSPRAIQSPVVNLPKPVVVKLPPVESSERRSIRQSNANVGRTNSTTSDWQNRIDKLLRQGKASDNMGLLSASSRAPLDVNVSQFVATVSLPTSSYKAFTFATDGSSSPITRSMDDGLFPQPEFGSTPTIQLPLMSHLNAALPEVFQRSPKISWREERAWDFSTAKSEFNVIDAVEGQKSGNIQIIIHLSPQAETKLIPFHLAAPNTFRTGTRPYRARRGHTDSIQSERGGRRGSGQFVPREGTNTSARGSHTIRGRPSRSSGFASRRNITAPASSTPVAH